MVLQTRRSFVLSAAAAGATLGLAGPVEFFPSAAAAAGDAHPLNPKALKFHKFKVGDIEVTTVLDGAIFRDHNPGFVKNASVDQVKASLKAAGLADDRVPNSYTVTFVRIGGRTIMFDSGNGAGRNPLVGHLAANAKAAGIDVSKLSAIVVTHFHPDHIFGLLTKENGQVYANTEIVVPDSEYAFWSDPGVVAKLPKARQGIAKRVQASMPKWKNLKRVAVGKEAVAGVRAVATNGHTPGHTSYMLGSGSGQFMVLGDVTSIPAVNMRNPGWHVMFDQDAKMAEATRRRTFDKAVADKIICSGYHWGMPGAGSVVKDGNGYAFVPVG
ncbi:MAG: MBL fold metallo-hydrolase [Hyphomicrobiaceae bacterium]|nr:MBL fold metallo-hydrolase [Hyphomicrobiaceae bacterium]